ncbi:MAG: hemerythrin domain-containing protein [Desulfovibrionales bacterium]
MNTLRHDHQEVKDIFKKMVKSSNESHRRELCNSLREEILPHMEGEERHIYPSLMSTKEAKADSLESLEEHKAAQTVLNELVEMDPSDERFIAKAKVLREMIEHHIKEEEDKIFDHLEDMKSDSELDDLLKQFNQTKEQTKSDITATA